MNEAVLRMAINELQEDLDRLNSEVRKKRQAINTLYETLGEKAPYEIEGESLGPQPRRRDQFYGKDFAVAAAEYLEMRHEACSVDEIVSGLEAGAFDFPWKASDRVRVAGISLSKNSQFRKLPNDSFGLSAWYQSEQPKLRKRIRPPWLGTEIESKDTGEGKEEPPESKQDDENKE
jgi:hypothetical protein